MTTKGAIMNKFQKVTAIIRTRQLEDVERQLIAMDVDGITVTLVKGFGEWHPEHYFGYDKPINRLVGHARIELYIESERAEAVSDAIARAAFTGEAGDGVIATLPVARFVHIRSYCHQSSADEGDDTSNGRSNQ